MSVFARHFSRLVQVLFLLFACSLQAAERPLNFIIILLDDMGLHDAGFMGNRFIETPAMDKLASEGVVFTQAYANAPNCAPSRAAIMSGQYAPRTGVYTMITGDMGPANERRVQTPKNLMYLPEQVYTLAELLHDHGYVTAQIGKWNLGSGPLRGPEGQGFDVNVGGSRVGSLHHGYWAPYGEDLPGLADAPDGEYMTDRLNREAVKFVEKNHDKPFFLYLSHFAPHFPVQAPRDRIEKYEKKRARDCAQPSMPIYCHMDDTYTEYAAMLSVVDDGIAALRQALQQRDLLNNTVIVLMSDNGGYRLAAEADALRGQKSQLYEGGIRVPMVWRVPAARAGSRVDVPVSGVDIYPSFAALAGIDVSKQLLDGKSLQALLLGSGKFTERSLFWYLPGYTYDLETGQDGGAGVQEHAASGFSQRPAAVMQKDGWKLIRYYDGTPSELYNLRKDVGEVHNVLATEKQRARDLSRELEQWLRDTGGVVTLPDNPAYQDVR